MHALSALAAVVIVAGGAVRCHAQKTPHVSFEVQSDMLADKTFNGLGCGSGRSFLDMGSNTIRNVHDRSPSKDPLLPLCGWVEPLVDAGMVCPLMALTEGQLRSQRRQPLDRTTDRTAFTTEKQPHNDGSLPITLKPTCRPLPELVDEAVIEAERHTYYFYYRLIMNFATYVRRWMAVNGDDSATEPPLVPEGWSCQRIYQFKDDDDETPQPPPIAQSLVRDDHMMLTIRGTIFYKEFRADLTYDYAPAEVSQRYGIAGRVHEGFLYASIDILDDLLDELRKHPNVSRLTIAGHSLGGAISTLLATMVAVKSPRLAIEVVAIGSPNVGDKDFARQFNNLKGLEARRVMYLGDGLKTSSGPFGFGDVVPQFPPPCWYFPGCVSNRTLVQDGGNKYYYATIGGGVVFYAEDMPNTARWHSKERGITRDSSVGSCHICAYLCWAVQGTGDPEDLCYFKDDPGEHQHLCPYGTTLRFGTGDLSLFGI